MILWCRLRYHRSVLAASVYDRFGNRFQQNGVFASSLTFSGNNNRIDGASGVYPERSRRDASGNLLNDGSGGHTFTYDAENRLISVTSTNGTSTYSYDAFGHRVERTGYNASSCAPGIADYVFDLQDHWILQLNSGGGPCADEIYIGSRHVGSNRGYVTWSHTDWLGNERLRITYPSVNNRAYDVKCQNLPFGDDLGPCPIAGGGDANGSPMHFTGKERDSESGLDNFGARYYSSSMGRFMRPDPDNAGASAHIPQSWNAYSYVLNNPINATDPTGLWCVWEDMTHDDRPEEGGATEAECSQQGGHWDPTDTITGMDAQGNISQEIQIEGQLTDADKLIIISNGIDSLTSTSSLSDTAANGYSWAMGAEGLWELPGALREGWIAIASWRMASKMAAVRAAGQAGIELAGVVQNTERIPSLTGTAAYRIPDILDKAAMIIGEVKNYSGTLSLTEQIKDDIQFAQKYGYTMVLKVSQNTELTAPLRLLVNDGTIKLVRFP